MEPGPPLRGATVRVPGDISSAAVFLVAAALVPRSRVSIRRVSLNPTRTGVLEALAAMGVRIDRSEVDPAVEPTGTLTVEDRKSTRLTSSHRL